MRRDSPYLVALTDYMGVAGWVEPDAAARVDAGDQSYRITQRGVEVLRETIV